MSYSKNNGRKRLGRIAITGGEANQRHDVKRQCQIKQSSHESHIKNDVGSHGDIQDDLSFSASFACDLDNDVDLMSALDKMESEGSKDSKKSNTKHDYKATNDTKTSLAARENVESCGKYLRHKHQVKDSKTPIIKKTPEQNKGQTQRKRRSSTRLSDNNLFDSPSDISWASPIGLSTPQFLKASKSKAHNTEQNRKSRRSASTPYAVTTKSKSSLPPSIDLSERSNPNLTPVRTTRASSARKGQNVKLPIEGLTDKCDADVNKSSRQQSKAVLKDCLDTPVRTGNSSTNNKSDFFKSLFAENISQAVEEENVANQKNPTLGNVKMSDKQVSDISDRNIATTRKEVNNSTSSNETENVRKQTLKNTSDILIDLENNSTTKVREDNVDIKDNEKPPKYLQPDISEDQLSLASWGLPDTVLKQYNSRGITHMFHWQAECLLLGKVLEGGNLVYSAPTSAGKTMVAELLVLKRVMETRKKAIIILPFVSVTREKMFYLQELYQDSGIHVGGFMGHHSPPGGFSSVDVAVCTIEKGNGIVNRLLETGKLNTLGIIVVDELHLVGDPHRGYLLELLLTKISYMSSQSKHTNIQENSSPIAIQVVGMSATLPNLDLLARWLHADLYHTDYRPVPLTECFKIGTALYDSSMNLMRDIDTTYAVKGDDDHVVPLCIETIRDGHSILIFCPTKNWCEKLAETVARELYNLLRNPSVAVAAKSGFVKASDLLVLPLDPVVLRDVIEQLRRTPVGLDTVLGRTVAYGVAYHHAGLTFDERDIVEGAFRQGILKVLIATSTLSSGVNLPARRVIIRTPIFHGQLIDFLTYKQMIGRAGRKGVDTAGESILLCKPNERAKAVKLVMGELPPVQSTLVRDEGESLSSSMKRAILEVVVSGVAMAPGDVAMYASCTLLAAGLPKDSDQTHKLIQQCIEFLQENEFVTPQNVTDDEGESSERFVPTQLGAAVLASSLSPDEGLIVFSELQRARQCFVLENELHIIYQVTPIYAGGISGAIDWYQFFCIWERLPADMKRVAELAGVKESFLAKSVRGAIPTKTIAQLKLVAIHKRFYTALVLHDLVHEMTLTDVARKYNCNKGQIQSLQQSSATFAGMVTVFCGRLGWSNLELILSQFQNRLTFGIQRELCDLVRISALNGQRARIMYNDGYQTVAALANAQIVDIETLLKNSSPFQSKKKQATETEWEAEERRKTRCIFLTGRKGVTEYEAAVVIIDEAKTLIQEELGGLGIQWRPPTADVGDKGSNIKSPVLTSPIAGNMQRSKPVRGRRKSRSLTRKSTSPQQKGDNSKTTPLLCVISPPPQKAQSKVEPDENNSDLKTSNIDKNSHAQQHRVTSNSGRQSKDLKELEKNQDNKTTCIQNKLLSGNVKEQSNTSKIYTPSKLTNQKVDNVTGANSNNSEIGKVNTKPEKVSNLQIKSNTVLKETTSVITTQAVIEIAPRTVTNSLKAPKTVIIGSQDGLRNSNSTRSDKRKENLVHQKKETNIEFEESMNLAQNDREVVGGNSNKQSERITSNENDLDISKQNRSVKFSKEVPILIDTPNIEQAKQQRKTRGIRLTETTRSIENEISIQRGNVQNDDNCIELNSKPTAVEHTPLDNAQKESKTLRENNLHDNQNKIISEMKNQSNRVNGGIQKTEYTATKVNTSDDIMVNLNANKEQTIINFTFADEFADSFDIDTQTTESLIKDKQSFQGSDSDSLKEKAISERNEANDIHKLTIANDDCFNSEALFSPEMETNLIATDENSTKEKGEIVKSTNANQIDGSIKEDVSKNENTDEDFDDLDLHLSESVNDINVTHNVLDNAMELNISPGSDLDMFNESADLIAASHYERVGFSDNSKIQDLKADESYQDLHIPYLSGQEMCFEKADVNKKCIVGVKSSNVECVKTVIGSDNLITGLKDCLGKFSSQKPVVKNQFDLHEDLAMALEMGHSFSSTFNASTVSNTVNTENAAKVENKGYDENDIDHFDDSLTFSMVEKVLEGTESANQNSEYDKPNLQTDSITPSDETKHNSDQALSGLKMELDDITKNSNKTKEPAKTLKLANNDAKDQSQIARCSDFSLESASMLEDMCQSFAVPKGGAVKRTRGQMPVGRTNKIQKTSDKGHSTPLALKTHNQRILASNSKSLEKSLKTSNASRRNSQKSEIILDKDNRKSESAIVKHSSASIKRSRSPDVKVSPCNHNTSTGSDCVPPTPPDDTSACQSPFRTHGNQGSSRTPNRTPLQSITSAMFSPKMRKSNLDTDKCNKQLKSNPQEIKKSFGSTKNSNTNGSLDDQTQSTNRETDLDNVSTKCNKNIIPAREFTNKKSNEQSCNAEKAKYDIPVRKITQNESDGNPCYSKKAKGDISQLDILEDKVETADDNEPEEEGNEDKLSPSFIDPDESILPLSQAGFTIIDVCADKRLFKTFVLEWRSKTRYAVSLACERKQCVQAAGVGIGANFRKELATNKQQPPPDSDGIPLDNEDLTITGIAVSWDNRDAYYVSFSHHAPQGLADDTFAPPPCDADISIGIRVKAVKSVLQRTSYDDNPITMVMFDVKAQYRALVTGCGFAPKGQFEDPKVACWMLDPGAKEKTLHRMVTNLLPTEAHMLEGIGGGIGVGSLGMSPQNPGSGRYRAATECVLVRHLAEYFKACLVKEDLYTAFCDIEMPATVSLCRMELNGFGFSQEESEHQKSVMAAKLSALEEQAYHLARHPFSLSATDDVAQVLFIELQLPPNGDPKAVPTARSLANNTRGGPRRGKGKCQLSTSKDVLEKLKKFHPLPGVILEWRRITNALTKVVFPLQKEKLSCEHLSMYRIYSEVQLHSATGRVSLSEPNLQNVPKDFDITMPDLIGESPPANQNHPSRDLRTRRGKLQHLIGEHQVARVTEDNIGTKFSISMRHAFVPFPGGVLLAADYSQLELRMIAYLSNDAKLIQILNEDGDVFKLITAQWKNITPEEVTSDQRAQAKQICYGMIYGIGPKALGEQLEVDENDAAAFIETFKAKYPGMRTYLRQTVQLCREKGYVKTMCGRKRYLDSITSTKPHARAQAERQAVNTTVQGSAADLAKMAMVKIDQKLSEIFHQTQYTHRHKLNDNHPSRQTSPPGGAYLVLQLHDELIYEVHESHVQQVTEIVKHAMEHAMELPVKMPVKVKVGPSWGTLAELQN